MGDKVRYLANDGQIAASVSAEEEQRTKRPSTGGFASVRARTVRWNPGDLSTSKLLRIILADGSSNRFSRT
jgi:hypothetical protein